MPNYSAIGKRSRRKGKSFQREIAKFISSKIGLKEDDVASCVGGKTESDVRLSCEAKKRFPFHVECKNYRRWAASAMKEWLKQSTGEAPTETTPIVVFKFHGESKPYVVLDFEAFLSWVC